MSARAKIDNLVKVKTQLAEKYERLAAEANSKPARAKAMRRAKSFRQQASNLSRLTC
ncbi:MAG: hypothetical protein MPJ50_16370 [Pirellulales bacterium]|nr:hypothetical protein [Pirellulales bacterium]